MWSESLYRESAEEWKGFAMVGNRIENVIIIGSGAAGHTAALYTARANLEPLVIEGIQPGGQLTITTDVENYPGFQDGIMGPEMMVIFKQQAERFGTRYELGEVTSVDFSVRPFEVTIDQTDVRYAQSVIVATGATAKLLGLPSEDALMGYGVSACATCDGFFFREKELVVVGGGDTAMEESTFLTKFASKVNIVHRRHELRASKIMQQRAFDNPKIEFVWDTVVEDILGVEQGEVTGVRLRNMKSGDVRVMPIDGVFLAIGHKPNTEVFQGILDMNDQGYILTHDGTKTKIPGVFAAGDAQDWIYRQAVTAAGTGCMAAIDAERWLSEQEASEPRPAEAMSSV